MKISKLFPFACVALMMSACASDKEEIGGGFWTPASAMGDSLLTRLEEHAGLSFEVIDA